jgi:hypothetical protein
MWIRRAAGSPFGGTIAHGYLTLALVTVFMSEIFRIDGLTMAINAGLNRVRFPAPVKVGSRVRGGAKLIGLKNPPAGKLSTVRVTVVPGRGPQPARRGPAHRGSRPADADAAPVARGHLPACLRRDQGAGGAPAGQRGPAGDPMAPPVTTAPGAAAADAMRDPPLTGSVQLGD